MRARQVLRLQGELPALNEIIGASKAHWSNYARVKRQNTYLVALQCRAQHLSPIDGPVEISFLHYRPSRKKDPDNVAAGAQKMILDGLVKAAILPNDTMQYVAALHHAFEVDRDNPRIDVLIEAIEANESEPTSST